MKRHSRATRRDVVVSTINGHDIREVRQNGMRTLYRVERKSHYRLQDAIDHADRMPVGAVR